MIKLLFLLKALHVVGFVSWFAGQFYLVRIFVNHAEAFDKPAAERDVLAPYFTGMEWRVYKIILNPAMIITWVAGLGMLVIGLFSEQVPNYFAMGTPGWMHLKLFLLVLLSGYHGWCKTIIPKLEKGSTPYSGWQFRLINEIPTLFLVSISFIAVLGKNGMLNYLYLVLGMLLFAGMIYRGAKAYSKRREREQG
ncbi:MAG: CopD family protein [Saprospiraceae bacterium]|nr:CopD family protein [Lewinella sp.]